MGLLKRCTALNTKKQEIDPPNFQIFSFSLSIDKADWLAGLLADGIRWQNERFAFFRVHFKPT